jgi:hypothetical protein
MHSSRSTHPNLSLKRINDQRKFASCDGGLLKVFGASEAQGNEDSRWSVIPGEKEVTQGWVLSLLEKVR